MVAAAAARDFNDELTVMLSGLDGVLDYLDDEHPALPLLAEMQGAMQRCAWKTSGVLQFAARRGVPPISASLDKLLTLERR